MNPLETTAAVMASFLFALAAGAADRDRLIAPVNAPSFAGRWQLDRVHSDDAAAPIAALIAARQKQLEQRRRERRARPLPPDGIPPLDVDNLPGEPAQAQKSRYEELLAPASEFIVAVSGNGLDIAGAGEPPRRYAPEEDGQRMDAYGTAQWRSGWQGNAFVIRARYTNGAVREQRLSLTPDATTLLVTLDFKDSRNAKVQLKSKYLRD